MKKEVILLLLFVFIFCSENLFSGERAFEMNRRLGMGINLGNCFEAPEIGSWGVEPDSFYFSDIKAKGFNSLRIPAKWSAHAQTEAPYTIDKDFMDTIRWAINLSLANGLVTVINIHHYDEIMTDPAANKARFLAIWDQIAHEFQSYSDSLYFEILNEPNTNLTPQLWNDYLAEGLSKIRETNPDRMVIIGTANWGGVDGLSQLTLPEDSNLILTIHYYNPFNFTHQGADFAGMGGSPAVSWDSTAVEVNAIKSDMDIIKQYSDRHNVPVYIGEFGAIENADDASRARWIGCLHSFYQEYGFSAAYWEYCSGFGIYNFGLDCYHTGMLKALTGVEAECDCSAFDTVIVKNATFDRTTQPWFLNTFPEYGANAEIKAIDGEARLEILSNGAENWYIQFIYSSFPLKNGYTYTLLFDAYASAPVTIQTDIGRDGGDYSVFHSIDANLTTEKKTFASTFTFNQPTENISRIAFECGLAKVQYIYFDNVHLYETGPQTAINPVASASECVLKAGNKRFTVEGNTIESVAIFDLQGRKCFQRQYGNTNYAEIEDSCIPTNVSFIEVKTDVKREVLKNLK